MPLEPFGEMHREVVAGNSDPLLLIFTEGQRWTPRYPVTVVAAANHLLDPQAPSTPGGSVPPPQHQNQQGQGTASSGCNWDPVVGPRPAPTYSVVNAIIEVKEDGPGSRCGHTLTAVAAVGEGTPGYIGPRLILFGAPQPSRAYSHWENHPHQGLHMLQQLWAPWWVEMPCRVVVQGPGPGPRYGHVMALVGQRFLLCIGGNDGRKRPLVDVWALDTAAKPYEWRKLEPEGEGPGIAIRIMSKPIISTYQD
ncbi:hypothetical protein HPP92_017675 [Vanilla planifolia]|uniref:Uncharacterized protein n=1 Tax=Vanilla planifolia TaxID=51239 RepID=A0A835Q8A9_VANPL|nr:hypothetical protein HPP92_017675 [Vanilla planifolia]